MVRPDFQMKPVKIKQPSLRNVPASMCLQHVKKLSRLQKVSCTHNANWEAWGSLLTPSCCGIQTKTGNMMWVSERYFVRDFLFLNAIICCLRFHFNFQVAGFHVSAKCESTWRKFPKNGKQRRRQMLSPFFVWIYYVQISLFCSCEQVRTAAEELTIRCKSLNNASVSENRVTDFAKKRRAPSPFIPLSLVPANALSNLWHSDKSQEPTTTHARALAVLVQ